MNMYIHIHYSDPQRTLTKNFSNRSKRLSACMEYDYGMGWIVVRLNDNGIDVLYESHVYV
jgi:hypothetical protein